jgi:serine/threonine protein kinase
MLNQKESNYNRLRRAKMDKAMFVKIKTLGIGAFGEVCLTRKVDTGALYAMKTLRKKDVLNRNQVAHVKVKLKANYHDDALHLVMFPCYCDAKSTFQRLVWNGQ